MSIATQIERLQNIKSAIRTALVNKGVSASTHNMADFANDIASIKVGTDVSDTTATASSVLKGKYFHLADGSKTEGTIETKTDSGNTTYTADTVQQTKSFASGYYPNAHGVKINAATSVTPSSTGSYIAKGGVYIPSVEGYAINDYSNITPSSDGARFESGFRRMSSGGYAYSEKPKVVDLINPGYTVHQSFGAKSTTVITCGFRPKYATMANRVATSTNSNIGIWAIDFDAQELITYWGAKLDTVAFSDLITNVSDTGFTFYMGGTAAQYWQMYIYS